jgi:SPP1 gp7 family putative phage head morphogenesis protein
LIEVLAELFSEQIAYAERNITHGDLFHVFDIRLFTEEYKKAEVILNEAYNFARREGKKLANKSKEEDILFGLMRGELIASNLSAELLAEITLGINKGESLEQLIDRIRKFYSDARNLRIARNEVMIFANYGALDAYRSSNIQRVIWFTAEDERVCQYCEELNGVIFDINSATMPPLHPACRCYLFPV